MTLLLTLIGLLCDFLIVSILIFMIGDVYSRFYKENKKNEK
jgi:large-conductance mechanosensitive channel